MENETSLIALSKNGDKTAFSSLMSLYEKRVYNYALRTTKNPDDALDISQEIFIKLYNSIKNFRGESAFSTFVFRIMANCCNDFLKKNNKTKAISLYYEDENEEEKVLSVPDETASPERQFEQAELKEILANAINSLSDDFREVFILKHINGQSLEEISDILGLEIGTVKSRLFRAREKIKCTLLKNGNFSAEMTSKYMKGGGQK